jgi:hypothetical protein
MGATRNNKSPGVQFPRCLIDSRAFLSRNSIFLQTSLEMLIPCIQVWPLNVTDSGAETIASQGDRSQR